MRIRRLKVLIYVPVAALDGEGATNTHVRELAEDLAKLGNQVTVVCQLNNTTYGGLASIKRVRKIDGKVVRFIFSTIHGLFLGMVTVSRRKYDLVYARAALNGFNAYLVASLARLPCVIEVNGLMRTEIKVGWVGWWRKAAGYIMSWFEDMSFRRCRHLIAVTPEIKEALIADLGLEPGKITVIPNGANIDLFKPMDSKLAKKRIGLTELSHLIVFVGHLIAWQGVEYLIRSIPRVVRDCPDATVLIVGEGLIKERLVKLAEQIGISDRVIFTGMIPYDKVPLYINASDICVAPFIREKNEILGVSPLKIYEYAACGKAIVTSRLPGLEFVEKCEMGVLIQPDSAEDLAKAIIKLLQNPELSKQMGENGRKYIVENHSWESVARKVAELCRQVIEEHRKNQNKKKP
jgi:glycosyltransferase involved in cell wall biosynthesis